MLVKSKNITVSGNSQIDGEIIGYFNAQISEDGNTSNSATIANRELYEANKSVYKADRNSFNDYVDGLVDGE